MRDDEELQEDEELEDEELDDALLDDDEEEGEDGEEGSKKKKKGLGKKKLLLVVGALLIVVLIGAGLFFAGIIGGGGGDSSKSGDPSLVPQTIYVDLDQFLVNLNNPGRQVSFLKVTITLELPNLSTKSEVDANIPRIRDSFQVYLRELRTTDLQGSAGIHRLREELILRVNKIIAPMHITDVLFKEIIVQ